MRALADAAREGGLSF
ncbi:MAG: hypothetical protein ACYDA7_08535 [Acidithiobacillus sp.]